MEVISPPKDLNVGRKFSAYINIDKPSTYICICLSIHPSICLYLQWSET